jgi:hypothetical protein
MTPLGKGLVILFGFPVVLSAGFFTYFLTTGEDRMKSVCAEVTPGMNYAELKEFALDKRLKVPAKEDAAVVFLADSRSYGRHSCKVELDAGVVKRAAYAFAD